RELAERCLRASDRRRALREAEPEHLPQHEDRPFERGQPARAATGLPGTPSRQAPPTALGPQGPLRQPCKVEHGACPRTTSWAAAAQLDRLGAIFSILREPPPARAGVGTVSEHPERGKIAKRPSGSRSEERRV